MGYKSDTVLKTPFLIPRFTVGYALRLPVSLCKVGTQRNGALYHLMNCIGSSGCPIVRVFIL